MTPAPVLNWHFRQFAKPGQHKVKPCALAVEPRQGALHGPQDHPGDGRQDDGCGLVANCAPLSPRVGPYPAPKIIPLMVARAAHAGWWPTARSCAPARGLSRPQDHRGVRRQAAARGLGADRVSLSPGGTFAGPLILVRPTSGDC